MNRYRNWTIAQGSRANCSPGLMILGIVGAVVVVIYVYREVIINTLIDVGIAVGIVCGIVLAIVLTMRAVQSRGIYRAQLDEAIADYQDEHDPVLDAEVRYAHEPADRPERVDVFPGPAAVVSDPRDRPVPAKLDAELDRDLADLLSE